MSQEYYVSAVSVAFDIMHMHQDITLLKEENERLKEIEQKYYTLLDKSLKQTQQLTGAVLEVMHIPGVMDALNADNLPEHKEKEE